jgi:hypothetical protein
MDEETVEYVVYRTGYPQPDPPLEYLEQRIWDKYLSETPKTLCVELSRGHTLVDAINLTMLANQQKEIEHEG